MEFRQLGNSGLKVSAFSLGSWLTYEFMTEAEALAVIECGITNGINFLDDARYNDRTGKAPLKSGYSEVLFGRLLRQGGWRREDLIIANKLWFEFYPQQNLEAELDGSLGRLEMDYLDLVYCAPPPPNLALLEMLSQLDKLIKSGKLRFWGVLNWPLAQLAEAYNLAKAENLALPCAAQLAYSLLQPAPVEDSETSGLFQDAKISVVASYSLHGGLLTGKYNQNEAALPGRFSGSEVETMQQKGLVAKVEAVTAIAQELGCTSAQLALAYCLKNPLVASVLFGATKVSQVKDNLQALEIIPLLNDKLLARLQNLT